MTPLDFKELYVREIDNLHKEISAYADESKLWIVSGQVKNSPGNLCLHLLGNINHHIGTTLGGTGYVRKRDEEFAVKGISKKKLLADITAAKAMVEKAFTGTAPAEMQKDFPAELFGKRSTEYMLCYFLGHFMYHWGQISYHRRLV